MDNLAPRPVTNTLINTNVTPTTINKSTIIPASSTAALQQPSTNPIDNEIITRRKLQELVNQVSPNTKLEIDVEEIMMDVADDFIESVTTFACNLAKHRKSTTLEVKDLQLHLERNWNIKVPGFSVEETKKRSLIQQSEVHKQRIEQIRKTTQAQQVAAKKAATVPNPNG